MVPDSAQTLLVILQVHFRSSQRKTLLLKGGNQLENDGTLEVKSNLAQAREMQMLRPCFLVILEKYQSRVKE